MITPDKGDTTTEPGSKVQVAISALIAMCSWSWLIWTLISLGNVLSMGGRLDQTGIVLVASTLTPPTLAATWAGAATGLLLRAWKGPRPLSIPIGGLSVGILSWVGIFAYFAADPIIATIIGALLLTCALIGSLFAVPHHQEKIRAALLATAVLMVFMILRGWLRPKTEQFFSEALDNYQAWATYLPLVAGLVIGIATFVYLRLRQRQTTLYGYVFAAATPGLIWLIAAIATQVGAELLVHQLADGLNPLDQASLHTSGRYEYNGAMTVLFTGTVTAILAYGLLIPKSSSKTTANSDG